MASTGGAWVDQPGASALSALAIANGISDGSVGEESGLGDSTVGLVSVEAWALTGFGEGAFGVTVVGFGVAEGDTGCAGSG